MKPNSARTSLISRSLDLISQAAPCPTAGTQSAPPVTPPPQPHKPAIRQHRLKKAVAVIRSKSKTRQLLELCEQAVRPAQKSDDWLARYEKFFRSPVWKLVSDEALRKAHFKCECWGCPGRAVQVHLLEFPEKHLEPDFDWMNRNNILIALCSHHYEMMHRLVLKRATAPDRQSEPTTTNLPGVHDHHDPSAQGRVLTQGV